MFYGSHLRQSPVRRLLARPSPVPEAVLYLAIPAHNEVATIGVLLWRLRTVFAEFPREYEVVVYDDASTDDTAAVAEQYERAMPVTVIRGTTRLGYAGATDALLRHVAGMTRYPRRDAVLLLQGDFTDPPGIIPEFARRFDGGADLVVGERLAVADAPAPVRRLFKGGQWLMRPFLRVEGVRDLTASMRLVRISALRDAMRVAGDSTLLAGDSWTANADLLLRLVPHARRVEAVPMEPTFGVRMRETRRVALRDSMALLKWSWQSRGRRAIAGSAADAGNDSDRRPPRQGRRPERHQEQELDIERLRERVRESAGPRDEGSRDERSRRGRDGGRDGRRERPTRSESSRENARENGRDNGRENGNDSARDLSRDPAEGPRPRNGASKPARLPRSERPERNEPRRERAERPERPEARRPSPNRPAPRLPLDPTVSLDDPFAAPSERPNEPVAESPVIWSPSMLSGRIPEAPSPESRADSEQDSNELIGAEGDQDTSDDATTEDSPRRRRNRRSRRGRRRRNGDEAEAGAPDSETQEGAAESEETGDSLTEGLSDSNEGDDSASDGNEGQGDEGDPNRPRRRGRRGRRGGARRSRGRRERDGESGESVESAGAPDSDTGDTRPRGRSHDRELGDPFAPPAPPPDPYA